MPVDGAQSELDCFYKRLLIVFFDQKKRLSYV